jgi:hypothetical protein
MRRDMFVSATYQRSNVHLNALDDKVDQLVLQHGLRVEVGDQERNIVSLRASRTNTST